MTVHIVPRAMRYETEEDAVKAGALTFAKSPKDVQITIAGEASPTFVLTFAEHFTPWSFGAIYRRRTGGFVYLDDLTRDPNRVQVLAQMGFAKEPTIEVAWGATSKNVALFCHAPVFANKKVFTPIDRVARSSELAEELMPGFAAKRTARVDARWKMMSKISLFDNLAALEKQVDLLSRLVFSLIEAMPTEKAPEWMGRYASIVDGYGADTFKDAENVLDDVEEIKRSTRQAQAEYFKSV